MLTSAILGYAAILLGASLINIGFALILQKTGGLFISRFITDFSKDRDNPNYEFERRVGLGASKMILKYVPPFAIGSFVIIVLTLLGVMN